MTTSEEKMAPDRFMELCAALPPDTHWGDAITPEIVAHIWQAALKFVNTNSESEAWTNLRLPPNAKRIEIKCFDCDGFEIGIGEGTGIETTGYLAPPEEQDGRTQLEEFGMKVAQEVKSATVYNECRNMLTKENELRAIVANLIGAGELSEAEYNANHSGKPINYIDKLRRMAEFTKGEKL